MVAHEYFQLRKLLWEELKLNIPASEEEELRSALGSHLIEENEELRQELVVLVEILYEFQQQNDDIRDALAKRTHFPEPPGRRLLVKKLKLLAADMQKYSDDGIIESLENAEMLNYVLSTVEMSNSYSFRALMAPLLSDIPSRPRTGDQTDGISLRPETRRCERLLTASSQRPDSRGSTLSISSITALFESTEDLRCLKLDEADGIKEDLRRALDEERFLLLDDIDFIQGCLEMEKDLIDDDRRKVAAAAMSPPSLSDLHDLRKTMEKTLQDQETLGTIENIIRRADNSSRIRILSPVSPSDCPSPFMRTEFPAIASRSVHSTLDDLPSPTRSRTTSATRVLKIRHIVQESRDESYLS